MFAVLNSNKASSVGYRVIWKACLSHESRKLSKYLEVFKEGLQANVVLPYSQKYAFVS